MGFEDLVILPPRIFKIYTDMFKNKCSDMLSMQIGVFAKTKDWDHTVASNV